MRQLEREYPGELVVIGVHSGKFPAERNTASIRQALLRLGVEHPVVNDRLFRIRRSYGVNSWPTVVLIDPQDRVADYHPGEIDFDTYRPVVARVVDEFERRGALNHEPVRLAPEAAAEPPRPLAFPGKVLVDRGRVFIADSGHHRIVVVSLHEGRASGSVEAIAGRGTPGLEDGSLQSAAFNAPQGMALQEGVLYVADAQNHAIRAVDLARRQVTTVAGTGAPARTFGPAGSALQVPLSSPWDLAAKGRELYIAMAGMHQIWRLDLGSGQVRPYAGSGLEELADGRGTGAALAQPSGISAADDRLYFADSESSAIRLAELPGGNVRTIAGTGLSAFGDRDGVAHEARLQHPLGLTWHNGLLYVADTYNNKIKIVDPQTRLAQTFLGAGEAGRRDGSNPLFYEPGGLAASGDRLYVADTNNHAIRVVDLSTREVSTLEIEGLEAPQALPEDTARCPSERIGALPR